MDMMSVEKAILKHVHAVRAFGLKLLKMERMESQTAAFTPVCPEQGVLYSYGLMKMSMPTILGRTR